MLRRALVNLGFRVYDAAWAFLVYLGLRVYDVA